MTLDEDRNLWDLDWGAVFLFNVKVFTFGILFVLLLMSSQAAFFLIAASCFSSDFISRLCKQVL